MFPLESLSCGSLLKYSDTEKNSISRSDRVEDDQQEVQYHRYSMHVHGIHVRARVFSKYGVRMLGILRMWDYHFLSTLEKLLERC